MLSLFSKLLYCLLIGLAAVSCSPEEQEAAAPPISVINEVTFPDQGTTPTAVTLRLSNIGTSTLSVKGVGTTVSEGLSVDVLGWSYCQEICPGVRPLPSAAAVERLRDVVETSWPMVVPPDDASESDGVPSIIVIVRREQGALRDECLTLSTLSLRLDSGEIHLRGRHGPLVGVRPDGVKCQGQV